MLFLILLTWFSIGLLGMEYRITGTIDGDERQEIENLLDEAEEEFLPRFELESNDRLNIYVCKDLQEFLRHTGVSWWNGGHFVHRTVYLQRLAVLRERGILRQTITHEFLHYCIWRKAGNDCPVWLNEGLVLNLTGEAQSMDCFHELTPVRISMPDLDKFLRGKDRDKAKEAYCQAAVLVRDLLKKDGFKNVLRILDQMKTGDH